MKKHPPTKKGAVNIRVSSYKNPHVRYCRAELNAWDKFAVVALFAAFNKFKSRTTLKVAILNGLAPPRSVYGSSPCELIIINAPRKRGKISIEATKIGQVS